MIRVRGLHKTYQVYRRPLDFALELLGRGPRHTERHVLRGIDLDVARGQVLGIMGRNGAGKSTLLRILAGTLNTSAGSVEIDGRISAILELGSGFHPRYTGRENVVMGGLCLGMSRAEVAARLDDIIDFSELRDVIDQPFWTYSTGMQARLTFATAVAVDPDVLIIDEALSVGDARFSAKCFRRVMDFRERGKTIILVSHDANAVLTFCDRAIVLEGGTIHADGEPREMAKVYGKLVFSSKTPSLPSAEQAPAPVFEARHGDGAVEILDYGIHDAAGESTRNLVSGERYRLFMRFRCHHAGRRYNCGFNIATARGVLIYGVTNESQRLDLSDVGEGEVVECSAEVTMWLSAGDFLLSLGVADADTGARADFIEDAVQFRVHGPGGIYTTALVNLETEFRLRREQTMDAAAS